MTRQVLAGIDGSTQSEAAAHWAAEEALRRGADLRLLHVWPWLDSEEGDPVRSGEMRPAALQALAATADRVRRAHPGLAVETAVVGADPVDGLVAAAEGQELMVLGSRGLGGFAGLLVGSTGLAVAARAGCPLVLVRAGVPFDGETDPVAEVVVGVDPGHQADPVLEFAFAEAELRGARVRAVHGWELTPAWAAAGWVPPPVDVAEQESSRRAALTAALAVWRDKFPATEVIEDVRLGGAAPAVLAACADADLVVVGRRERRHGLGMRLGPVAHAVLHHAAAPVAVVPHA